MKFTYLGHAGFIVEYEDKTIVIDPWLNGPTSPMKIEHINEANAVLVTHDHGDHGYEEAIDICKKTGAPLIAINELALQAKAKHGLKKVHTLNIGGSVEVDGIRITLVQAFHSCGTGAPTGFIVQFPNESFYHAGDTGVFSSMKIFADLYSPDVALLPIGSYYTCGTKEAAYAAHLVRPKVVIPMHYDTFPVIAANTEEFTRYVEAYAPHVKVEIMKPGEARDIP